MIIKHFIKSQTDRHLMRISNVLLTSIGYGLAATLIHCFEYIYVPNYKLAPQQPLATTLFSHLNITTRQISHKIKTIIFIKAPFIQSTC